MPDRPNVVLITTDQQRADLSAREGYPLDTTPFLDDLADRGAWFERAYTPTPLCGPARVSLLTGRYPTATGVWANATRDVARYDADLFDAFGEAGYETALFGKNHSHLSPDDVDHWVQYGHFGAIGEASQSRRDEADEAFDDWLGGHSIFEAGSGGFALEPTPFPVETQMAARSVDAAVDFLEDRGTDPFCLWLSIPEPHNPFQVPEPYFSMFPPEDLPDPESDEGDLEGRPYPWRHLRTLCEERWNEGAPDVDHDELLDRLRATYHGMCRMVDDQLRRFVEALDDHGLRDDTIVVVTSDHGDFVGEYGMMRKGVGLPEVTTRVPLVVDGPGVADLDGAPEAHVSLVDLLPTLCDAADVTTPDGVQGRNLWPTLTGEGVPEQFDRVYAETGIGGSYHTAESAAELEPTVNELNAVSQSGRQAMVRRGDLKVVADHRGDVSAYDLDDDPRELADVSDDPGYREEVAALLADLLGDSIAARDGAIPDDYVRREGVDSNPGSD